MNTDTLYYNRPGEYWMEALPLGNGSLGAMSDSGVKAETISLNHDTLWTGHPRTVTKEGAFESYKKAQRLALDGKYKECHEEIQQNFLTCWSQAYLTFGTLQLKFDFEGYSDYQRSLDLSKAVLNSRFLADGVEYMKTAFVSHPHNVLVYRIKNREGSRFSFEVTMECPLKHEIYAREDMLLVDGECPGDADTYSPVYPCNSLIYSQEEKERGVLFRGAVKVDCDGRIVCAGSSLKVRNVTCATLYFNISTSFNGFDKYPAIDGKEYKDACIHTLRSAFKSGYEAVLKSHTADYERLYDRVTLNLGGESGEPVPTDERLKKFAEDPSDTALYTLLFNFGRYLLIASSRPGSTAANLQGIWNNRVQAPWNSNYTVNINTEMNYWPALPCNLPELMEPLTDLIRTVSVTGEQTAWDFYHARGFVLHHNTDLWGHTAPVHGGVEWAFWPGGSGWLCQNLFEIYRYTLNREFLRDTAFPLMKKAARFYLDILIEDGDGSLIVCPATSPENVFKVGEGYAATAKSTAMMNMIVLDLFTNCKSACEALEIADSFYEDICRAIPKIKPLKIGENGTVLEWNEPLPEREIHHRHVSHLYALHPAGLIRPDRDRKLFEASRKTLEIRGDKGTGWSLAWKVNFQARLRDGNHALKLLQRQLNYIPARANESASSMYGGGTYPNMMDAHPPFQIDGNFGAVSGICEMLLQSDGEHIYLLPALPDGWPDGSVKGLAARGNVTVDMEWEEGKLKDYTIHGENKGLKVIPCR